MHVECPACGEPQPRRLKGERRGDSIHIRCLSCGHEWDRIPDSCAECGSQTVPRREPLLQKARGTQQSIIGYRIVRECTACGATR